MLTVLLSVAMQSAAEAAIRRELLRLKPGAAATVKNRIRGDQTVDYQLRAAAGQLLTVTLKAGNRSAYFNVLPPGSDEAIFIGSTSGSHCQTGLPVDGIYTIRVYLMRSAARRNETASYTLTVKSSEPDPVFDRGLELQGVRFQVTSRSSGSLTTVRIVPSGLEIDNSPLESTIDGTITGAEVADLNGDGSPEIYVYVTSAGSGSYGSLVAYSANRRKSLSAIFLPPLQDDAINSAGYMGHDQFAVLEGVLGRRFPLYRTGDTNAAPSGGMRQLQYKLVPGEAGWLLTVDRVVEY